MQNSLASSLILPANVNSSIRLSLHDDRTG